MKLEARSRRFKLLKNSLLTQYEILFLITNIVIQRNVPSRFASRRHIFIYKISNCLLRSFLQFFDSLILLNDVQRQFFYFL